MSGLAQRWLVTPSARPAAALRLVAFPHAGGSASFYRALAAALPPSVELLAFQPPGRSFRLDEPAAETMDELVEQGLRALATVRDERPLALFGHSMGAIVAFETARRLEAEARGPRAVIVSGARAPHLFQDGRFSGLADQDDEVLLSLMRKLGGTEEGLYKIADFRALLLAPMRHDYRLLDRYQFAAGPKLRAPLTVIGGMSDQQALPTALRSWADVAETPCRMRIFPGGHFYFLGAEAELANLIATALVDSRSPARAVSPEAVRIFGLDLTRAASRLAQFRSYLSADELERASQFATAGLAERWLMSRGFLRETLAAVLGVAPTAVTFEYGAHGKPRLACDGGLHFNLSHADSLVLVATSVDREVGIDVESLTALGGGEGAESAVVSEACRDAFARLAPDERRAELLRRWVVKEALVKASGQGITSQFQAMTPIADDSCPDRFRHERHSAVLIDAPSGYAAAVAAAGDDWRPASVVWSS